MDKKPLEQSGLNKNESLVYSELLENGEMSPREIASATSLSRENAYNVVNALIQKGLVEQTPNVKKKVVRPLSPTKLREMAERDKKSAEDKAKVIDSLIPGLMNIYNLSTNKPSVSYFEGIEGIKRVYEDTLRDNPKETVVFRSIYDDEIFDDYLKDYLRRRAKMGIKNRILGPEGYFMGGAGTDKELNRESKMVDAKLFSLPTEITVYNNKVSVISLRKDKIGVIIESQDFAESMRNIFDYIWNK